MILFKTLKQDLQFINIIFMYYIIIFYEILNNIYFTFFISSLYLFQINGLNHKFP